jgi:tetratricopeptide (TPR) repeat protein
VAECSDDFFCGLQAIQDGHLRQAERSFRAAYEAAAQSDPCRDTYLSYYGLARVSRGDASGIELCRRALHNQQRKAALVDADIYENLARAELQLDNRKTAIELLKLGLKQNPYHHGLRSLRQQLGVRRRSALPFLPRSHPLNQALGRALRGGALL